MARSSISDSIQNFRIFFFNQDFPALYIFFGPWWIIQIVACRKKTDRVVALSGLSARIVRALGGCQSFGIFELYLHRNLLWRRSGPMERIETGPSEVPSCLGWHTLEASSLWMMRMANWKSSRTSGSLTGTGKPWSLMYGSFGIAI
jgi:hypothetical protein